MGAYIGKSFVERTAGAFTMGAWTADAYGDAVKPHGHADAHFMFVIAGDYVTNADEAGGANLPTLVFNPKDTYHDDRFLTPNGSFFSLTIRGMPVNGDDGVRAPQAPTAVANARAIALMQRLLRAAAHWREDMAPHAESLSLELIALASRTPGERAMPRWLARACDALDSQPERKIRIADLANEAKVHPVHFARTFRNVLGCTAGEYQRNARLRRAARLISKTRIPLTDVAVDSGFADQSHLTHRFTAAYGLAPGRFRALTA